MSLHIQIGRTVYKWRCTALWLAVSAAMIGLTIALERTGVL